MKINVPDELVRKYQQLRAVHKEAVKAAPRVYNRGKFDPYAAAAADAYDDVTPERVAILRQIYDIVQEALNGDE